MNDPHGGKAMTVVHMNADTGCRQITWTKELISGIAIIDEQHRALVGLANTMVNLFGTRQTELLGASLQQLLGYVDHHFATEEDLMREMGVDIIDAHIAEHDAIREHVAELADNLDSLTPEELFETLSHWIVHHIRDEATAIRGAN